LSLQYEYKAPVLFIITFRFVQMFLSPLF